MATVTYNVDGCELILSLTITRSVDRIDAKKLLTLDLAVRREVYIYSQSVKVTLIANLVVLA